MEKTLPPLDSRWDNSIPNQTNPPTPNFDRNGAMGPNELGTIVPQIPMEPNGLTGKSLSEALLFAEHGENMLCTKIVLNVRNNFCTQHYLPRFELEMFMY